MVHAYPVNDERLHELTLGCWCQPHVDWADKEGTIYPRGPVVLHDAADGREIVEAATGEGWQPDKYWIVHEN